MERVLIIDDDVELCSMIAEYLRPEGFEVEAVHNGERGLQRALSGDHDLLLLDVMLPGMNGFDLLRQLRTSSDLRVLLLTARGDDVDRIVGLEIGADDYLPKPFNPRELLARVRAILRRPQNGKDGPESGERLTVGDVELDLGARTTTRTGEAIDLTSVEFSLLEALLRSAGKIVSREELAQKVLGRNLNLFDRSIDVHISKLRKKLGEMVSGAERIKTVRGAGYLYALPASEQKAGER